MKEGLFTVDANVLLSFYRYSPSARQAFVDVFAALGDRLWLSHQAGREFWRNRTRALDDRTTATKVLTDQLQVAMSTAEGAVSGWAKRTAAADSIVESLREPLVKAFEDARKKALDEFHEDVAFSYIPAEDPVVKEFQELFTADNLGLPLGTEDWRHAVDEGHRRCKERIPPGFKDAEKMDGGAPEGAAGDYLVWHQSLIEAKRRGIPLVVLTGDEKEDWWWKHRTTLLGPREELYKECIAVANVPLFLLRPRDLLEHAAVLNVSVSADTVGEVARTAGANTPVPWTEQGLTELLERLDAEGVVHAKVIRVAASSGGTISRKRLFEVANFPEDRMLRGFTKPVRRITNDLQAEGIVANGVADVLTPDYAGGVLAEHFRVPDEITRILTAGADG